jgi:hypothetical protein
VDFEGWNGICQDFYVAVTQDGFLVANFCEGVRRLPVRNGKKCGYSPVVKEEA